MVIVSEEGELRVSIYSAFPIRKSLLYQILTQQFVHVLILQMVL
jgi:hypothetical protein